MPVFNEFKAMRMKACTTCNKAVTTGYVEFKCPNCLEPGIVRCEPCRARSKQYKCPKCGFEGP